MPSDGRRPARRDAPVRADRDECARPASRAPRPDPRSYSLADRVTLVYLGGPLDGQVLVMPARSVAALPPIRVPYWTRTQRHWYTARPWDGIAGRIEIVYRGITGTRNTGGSRFEVRGS